MLGFLFKLRQLKFSPLCRNNTPPVAFVSSFKKGQKTWLLSKHRKKKWVAWSGVIGAKREGGGGETFTIGKVSGGSRQGKKDPRSSRYL